MQMRECIWSHTNSQVRSAFAGFQGVPKIHFRSLTRPPAPGPGPVSPGPGPWEVNVGQADGRMGSRRGGQAKRSIYSFGACATSGKRWIDNNTCEQMLEVIHDLSSRSLWPLRGMVGSDGVGSTVAWWRWQIWKDLGGWVLSFHVKYGHQEIHNLGIWTFMIKHKSCVC